VTPVKDKKATNLFIHAEKAEMEIKFTIQRKREIEKIIY